LYTFFRSLEFSHFTRQDLIKTANLLFSQLDSAYVWTVCGRHFSAACAAQAGSESTAGGPVQPVGSESTNIPEICELVSFLLDIVSIETYVETSSEHLPRFFRQRVVLKSRTRFLPFRIRLDRDPILDQLLLHV
jgi:hypothetical protein